MDGCPVDAIHRGTKSLEMRIDPHCIGCSLCATNCPYESIQMVARDGGSGRRIASVARKAVNCDLCQGLVPEGAETFCVSACPHEAAFRWDGGELLGRVAGRG
jgi:anaerobic dimethyl sulfoxide reductase subunit B (iron-sulfur subunit)